MKLKRGPGYQDATSDTIGVANWRVYTRNLPTGIVLEYIGRETICSYVQDGCININRNGTKIKMTLTKSP